MKDLIEEPYELPDLRAALAEHGHLPRHMAEWLLGEYDNRCREVSNLIVEWQDKDEELERVRLELARLELVVCCSQNDRWSIETAARSVC